MSIIFERIDRSWSGIRDYNTENNKSPSKKTVKTKEQVLLDFKETISVLFSKIQFGKNELSRNSLEELSLKIKKIQLENVCEEVLELCDLIDPIHFQTCFTERMENAISAIEGKSPKKNKGNVVDKEYKMQTIFSEMKVFLTLLKARRGLLSCREASRDFEKSKTELLTSMAEIGSALDIVQLAALFSKIKDLVTPKTRKVQSTRTADVQLSEELLSSMMQKINDEEEKTSAEQNDLKPQLNISTITSFIQNEMDLKNLDYMWLSVKEVLDSKENLTCQEGVKYVHFNRMFLKALCVIGESSKDLSRQFKEKHPAMPWSFFNKLRNIIFHSAIDTSLGRKRLLDFMLANATIEKLDTISFVSECVEELSRFQVNLTVVRDELRGDFKVSNLNLASEPAVVKVENGRSSVLSPIKKILGLKHIGQKATNYYLNQLIYYFDSPINENEANSNLAGIMFVNQFQEENILDFFAKEIQFVSQSLKFLQENGQTKKTPILHVRSLEFSLSYLGQLSRLLKDQSKIFNDYVNGDFLSELEQLIIQRGAIAHRSALSSISISFNYYNHLVTKLLPMLQFSKCFIKVQHVKNTIISISEYVASHKNEFYAVEEKFGKPNKILLEIRNNALISSGTLKDFSEIEDVFSAIAIYENTSYIRKVLENCEKFKFVKINLLVDLMNLKAMFIELHAEIVNFENNNVFNLSQPQQKIPEYLLSLFSNYDAVIKSMHEQILALEMQALTSEEYQQESILRVQAKVAQDASAELEMLKQYANSIDLKLNETLNAAKEIKCIHADLSGSLKESQSFSEVFSLLSALQSNIGKLIVEINEKRVDLNFTELCQYIPNEQQMLFLENHKKLCASLDTSYANLVLQLEQIKIAFSAKKTSLYQRIRNLSLDENTESPCQKYFSEKYVPVYQHCFSVLAKAEPFAVVEKDLVEVKSSIDGRHKMHALLVRGYTQAAIASTLDHQDSPVAMTSSSYQPTPTQVLAFCNKDKLSPEKKSSSSGDGVNARDSTDKENKFASPTHTPPRSPKKVANVSHEKIKGRRLNFNNT